jgi:hypothetical protein
MPNLNLELSGEALCELDHYARSKGRKLETLLAEWIELICEYPDPATQTMRQVASTSALPADELEPELGDLARRAGLMHRRKRLKRPVVTFDRKSGPEETEQAVAAPSSAVGAGKGGAIGAGGGVAIGGGIGAAGNGPAI